MQVTALKGFDSVSVQTALTPHGWELQGSSHSEFRHAFPTPQSESVRHPTHFPFRHAFPNPQSASARHPMQFPLRHNFPTPQSESVRHPIGISMDREHSWFGSPWNPCWHEQMAIPVSAEHSVFWPHFTTVQGSIHSPLWHTEPCGHCAFVAHPIAVQNLCGSPVKEGTHWHEAS